MDRINDILGKLQDSLNIKSNDINPVDIEEFGPGFTNQYPQTSGATDDPEDDYIDVPDVDGVDTPYTTNRPFALPKGKKGGSNYLPFESAAIRAIKEAEKKEEEKTTEKEVDTEIEPPVEEPKEEEMEPETGGMDAGMDTGMDTGMGNNMNMAGMGMGEQEEPKTAGQLGRIYELKKIYSRLTAIESYLASESSSDLLEIRSYVSQSIELFEIISANFDSYSEKLDEIIIMYYKFLLEVYSNVKDYYKKERNSGDI